MLALLGETVTPTTTLLLTVMYNVTSPWSVFGKSEIATRKLKDPAAVGVPVTVPVLVFRESPGGMTPWTKENWYGAAPPFTLGVALYGTPSEAIGSWLGAMLIRLLPLVRVSALADVNRTENRNRQKKAFEPSPANGLAVTRGACFDCISPSYRKFGGNSTTTSSQLRL